MEKKIILVSHSRTGDAVKPGEKYSEVWTDICDGAQEEANGMGVGLEVFTPRESYHDNEEFLLNVERAVRRQPGGIILPFTPTQESLVNKLLEILENFEGRIVAVNVPPSPLYRKGLGEKIVGYVGMNEVEAGEIAAMYLIKKFIERGLDISEILVLKHEKDHYAFNLRIEGIEKMARRYNISTKTLFVGVEEKQQREALEPISKSEIKKIGIVTLGVRGTEAVLSYLLSSDVVIAGIDLNDKVQEGIKEGRVVATCIQHPETQGQLAVKLMWEVLRPPGPFEFLRPPGYKEIYCGPTLITKNNLEIFSRLRYL